MSGRVSRFIPEWLAGALCLAIPGFYNGFPFVNADTGAYIENGYLLQVPLDRPLGYSVFLRLGLMDISLWVPVLIQCLIVSGLLITLSRHFLGGVYTRGRITGILFFLGCLSSAGWFAAQLSPDIFSAILILTALCLALVPMSRPWRWLLYALILLSILCHNSNLLITAGAGALLLLGSVKRRDLRRPGLELFIPAIIGGLTLCSLNAIAGRGFRPSAGSHVFLVSRMVETGMMESYLSDYCPVDSPRYRLCDWQGRLPHWQWDFMWGAESPLQQAGGWQAVEPEYNRIVRGTIARPKYIGLHVKNAVTGMLTQLPLLEVGDGLLSFGPGASPYDRIGTYHPTELKQLRTSIQSQSKLPLERWNPLIIIAELLLMVAPLFLPGDERLREAGFRKAAALCILLLLINAVMTATFATVIARYEARVFWILPFLSILYVLRWLHFRTQKSSPQP